jgi:hypothetical protein
MAQGKHDDPGRAESRRVPEDQYTEDLRRDSAGSDADRTMEELARPGSQSLGAPTTQPHTGPDRERGQHARKGHAQSPVEDTLNQPEKKREGHR